MEHDVTRGQDIIFRHLMDQNDDIKSVIDKSDEIDVKERVMPDNWDMEKEMEKADS